MPRAARIDIPGLLYHVIVRGIERRDIFLDDADRRSFLDRLTLLLEKTQTRCFAWALLSNHFHLLLSPGAVKLSTFMRRLLTGHAVTFNLRHQRSGHLFQNRYKSLVCQEDEYLLQLVRYIHLNPLRANIVADLAALERYPWSGHRTLLGKQEGAGQDVAAVLSLFGGKRGEAKRRYRDFVADGVAEGKRGDPVGQAERKGQAFIDSTVLGAPDFVKEVRSYRPDRAPAARRSIDEIIETVAAAEGVSARAVSGGSRHQVIVRARSRICRLALEEGHSAAEIGRNLGLSRYGVGQAARKNDAAVVLE